MRNWKLFAVAAFFITLITGIWIGLSFFSKKEKENSLPPVQILESFYKDESAYQTAFAEAATSSALPAYAVVTSHHFLAKSLIARSFTNIDPTDIKTIILVSPDHFNALEKPDVIGVTTRSPWHTPFGHIEVNPAQVEMVTSLGNIQENVDPFLNEHGVYTVIPFLKKQFPKATVVPIILRQSINFSDYTQLGKNLHQFFNPDETLVVISSDFTHNKTPEAALMDDQKSIAALETHTSTDASLISSDCQSCMAVLFGYLENLPTQFQLIENTNSFEISKQSPTDVTSYVSGIYTKQGNAPIWSPFIPPATVVPTVSPPPKPITLLFGGDMMFDRNIRLRMQQYGNEHILKDLVPLFQKYDLVIANLEGPLTTNPSRSIGSVPGSTNNFIFTFDPSVAQLLYDQHIRVVNLGNNHILNQGKDGVTQSKQYLKKAKVEFFGDSGLETDSAERTLIVDISGVKFGFVNYNQFISGGLEHTIADLKYIRPLVDIVIVHPHWGNEYVPTANAHIQSDAHRFIDEGADLVIGAHPHVIQNTEVYKDKTIYYSLGNLVFDQYFSQETKDGMLVGVTIDPITKKMTFEEFRTELKNNGQTVLKETTTQ